MNQKQLRCGPASWELRTLEAEALRGLIDNPQLIIADEEKIIVEETRGNQVVIEEKSLVDTVYALKDQLSSMAQNYQELRNEFEVERKRMQSLKKLIDQWLPLIRDLKASTNL